MRHTSCFRLFALAAFAAVLLSSARAHATDSCYFGGPLLPNYTLNGSASMDGEYILVTPNRGRLNSSVFFNPPFSTSGDLHIKLVLQITTDPGRLGADGVAFVMHNDPRGPKAIGYPGDRMGYGYYYAKEDGIYPSVVVELDTYNNSYFGDPSANHIAITRGGSADHTAAVNTGLPMLNLDSSGFQLKSNAPIYLWVDYTAAKTQLDVYLSDTDSRPAAPRLSTNQINLATELGSRFYMGFTGSTGNEWSEHKVLGLYATDTLSEPEQACCDSDDDCDESPFGKVCDTAKHTCGECVLDDTTQCAASHKSCSLEAANNRCVEACNGNHGSGTSRACGAAAFPVCVSSGLTAGSCSSCNGDDDSGAAFPCGAQTPYCSITGYCGFCTTNEDCTSAGVMHTGPFCDSGTGTCVTTCDEDSDCGGGAYCDTAGACVPKMPNGERVPGDTCTELLASRMCLSGVCETLDERCGLVNGTALPEAADAGQVCRSGVADADGKCGLANGTALPEAADAGQVCRSGVADADGKCGLADGSAVSADAAPENVCRSGRSTLQRCGGPGAVGRIEGFGMGCTALPAASFNWLLVASLAVLHGRRRKP